MCQYPLQFTATYFPDRTARSMHDGEREPASRPLRGSRIAHSSRRCSIYPPCIYPATQPIPLRASPPASGTLNNTILQSLFAAPLAPEDRGDGTGPRVYSAIVVKALWSSSSYEVPVRLVMERDWALPPLVHRPRPRPRCRARRRVCRHLQQPLDWTR